MRLVTTILVREALEFMTPEPGKGRNGCIAKT